jgi:integrase
VLTFTGCRLSEALALYRDHIDEGAITIRTLKRRKLVFRRVPVPEWLCAALIAEAGQGQPIFNVHRTTGYRWVKRAMRCSGVSGAQACPKGLRHGFGIRAALGKAPISLVQRWLGHASPVTTSIYLDAEGDEERHFADVCWQRLSTRSGA